MTIPSDDRLAAELNAARTPPDAATLASLNAMLENVEAQYNSFSPNAIIGLLKRYQSALRSAEARVKELEGENDKLRYLVASGNGDCIYCKLPAAYMAKCASGFPGCARADDLLASMDDYSLPTPPQPEGKG